MPRSIVISDEEAALLEDLLRTELSNEYSEVRRTRNPDYRDRLHQRRDVAEHLLERLHEPQPAPDDTDCR